MQSLTVVIPMFRTGEITAHVVKALANCRLPEDIRLAIVVVDDHSCDGSAERIEAIDNPLVTLVSQSENSGRSAARNRGARCATEGHLLFLDSDCVPEDDAFIVRHLETLNQGYTVSMGTVVGNGDGFWHAYQASALHRRWRASLKYGIATYGSSQNFAIRRDVFVEVGGFDEGYDNYGFEDRDLFLRIEERNHGFAWTTDAVVQHRDSLDLIRVCAKMKEAGGPPALRFRQRHSEAYARLGYGSLDARMKPWLRCIEPITTTCLRLFLPLVHKNLNTDWIPIRLRMALVRAMVAASYLRGTARRLSGFPEQINKRGNGRSPW